MTPEQLQKLNQDAQSTLNELMNILNHTPKLASAIMPLTQSQDILGDFQVLSRDEPDIAEQLLRLTLATTVNYHTTIETKSQLAKADS